MRHGTARGRRLPKHSVLYLNKWLVNKGPVVWDEAAIEKRAKWLHNRFVRIWPHVSDVEDG